MRNLDESRHRAGLPRGHPATRGTHPPGHRDITRLPLAPRLSSFHFMNPNIAELIVKTLAAAGVKRVYGVVGDSLNGLTEALRKQRTIEWVPVRHEEVAAFAAGAEAHLTGSLALCAGSCGPGNMHLINGLYD